MLILKNYQKATIEATSSFLESVLVKGPERAFIESRATPGLPVPDYRTNGLGDIPYFCLRVPTGGGKTLLASYLLRSVAHDYLMKSKMMVLWLVPTNIILSQTLKALREARHPYREAIDDYFGSSVSIFGISEISTITPDVLESDLCIVVGTIQSLRTESTDARNVYDHWEVFETHFTELKSIPEALEKDENGNLKFSFANICNMHKPVIIMDEAHNARTKLSFDVLKRLAPSCVIELTATPNTTRDNGSNVLYSVTALELKSEDMIKLPIVLTEHSHWQSAVSGAVMTLSRLRAEAKAEDQYIRPIVLYQAQHKGNEITYDVLLDYLVNQEFIPREKIAIATGEIRELEHLDLFDPHCQIEHIITVEALKEGWDCSFAYVFCSVSSRSSQKDVEQLLGRVLRMPYATKRKSPILNLAYAHISSPDFALAAKSLQDTLVEKLGFERFEADYSVVSGHNAKNSSDQIDLFDDSQEREIAVREINTEMLSKRVLEQLTVNPTDYGSVIRISGSIDSEMENQILTAVPESEKSSVKKKIDQIRLSEIDYGQIIQPKYASFRVPRLSYKDEQNVIPLEQDDFLDFGQWDLNRFSAELPEFQILEEDNIWMIDVDAQSRIKLAHDHSIDQIKIDPKIDEMTMSELSLWLDRNVDHRDIVQAKSLYYISRTLKFLIEVKGIHLEQLLAAKFYLAKAITHKINEHRRTARKEGYQSIIFESNPNLVVDFNYGFDFNPGLPHYPLTQAHSSSRYTFKKHYYEVVSSMNSEEEGCAIILDSHPKVKFWIRNLECKPEQAFWLPTSTDKFYPDFIALLNDGRLLAIEYKGEMLKTADDTKEKELVGFVWMKQSNEKCLFLMAVKKNGRGLDLKSQIEEVIGG